MVSLASPQIHLHTGAVAIDGSGEICIVCTGAILSFRIHGVAVAASSTEIVLLEIAGGFGKSVLVKSVMP